MIQAPLQLQDYWVDFIQTRTNKAYDPTSPADLDLEFIQADAKVEQVQGSVTEGCGTGWLVNLVIEQTIPEGKNIPYAFKLDLSGLVAVHPSICGDRLEKVIQVNGPALLFGAAREILRAATGRGPFAPVIIPSTNFLARLSDTSESGAKALPMEEKSSKKTARNATGKKKTSTKRS